MAESPAHGRQGMWMHCHCHSVAMVRPGGWAEHAQFLLPASLIRPASPAHGEQMRWGERLGCDAGGSLERGGWRLLWQRPSDIPEITFPAWVRIPGCLMRVSSLSIYISAISFIGCAILCCLGWSLTLLHKSYFLVSKERCMCTHVRVCVCVYPVHCCQQHSTIYLKFLCTCENLHILRPLHYT